MQQIRIRYLADGAATTISDDFKFATLIIEVSGFGLDVIQFFVASTFGTSGGCLVIDRNKVGFNWIFYPT